MRKQLKIALLMIGVILLFAIIQFKFPEKNSWKQWNLPLSGQIIVLDPGHGGPDGGAENGNILEKDIALQVSLKLRDYLQEQGALVLMTREDDTDLASEGTRGYSRRKSEDLKKRAAFINDSEADLYVSIHLNSIPSPRWSGAQTFYFSAYKENEVIAKFIQDELRTNLENTTRKAKPINSVYLLKKVKKPGALVEIGFLSNEREKQLLSTDNYQDKVAESIYKGILRFYSNEKNPPD
ncbi:N-acetylmuramoyl-L-alanine amidase CwlD [Bacillus timonensis]|nr:N-acetylmuramoyl-L-alanine amidase CwlD [Bacillus timonensis]